MITRRGFFRGLLAAATTAVAQAYVPSVLRVPATRTQIELLEPLSPATQRLCNDIAELHARIFIYGDEAARRWMEYKVNPPICDVKIRDISPDIAMLDQWHEVDEQIARLG